ncbi:MAG: IS21 family transposase [Oscillospiraceae bacterium]|nr:IS21 family transposase [Oscillospiraceae bacterium]
MIELDKKFEVLQGYYICGKGIKTIARESKVSKTTVRKYIREYGAQKDEILSGGSKSEIILAMTEVPKYKKREPGQSRVITPEIAEIIKNCLKENERKRTLGQEKICMKSIDIYELLREKGVQISYPSVNNYAKAAAEKIKEAYIKQTYEYGEVCEFDWCEAKLMIAKKLVTFRLAVFTLAATNIRYGILYRTEDTQAFIDAHIRFFAYIGGVPQCMVYDNMKVAIAKFVGRSEKESTVAMKQLSTYYGFWYRFCNIRKANEKGHVERSCEYVRRKAYSRVSEFESEEEAQMRLTETVGRLNADKIDKLELERGAMLPKVPDYSSIVRTNGIVDKFSCISYKQNHYSVEDYLVGKEVEILAYTDEIVIKCEGEEVGRHKRTYENHVYILDIMHYRRTLSRKPGALRSSLCLKESCEELRGIYEKYFRSSPKEFILALDLLDEYTVSQVESAINILTEAGATVQYDSLKMMLGNKTYEYQYDENNEIEQACEAQLKKYAEVGA